MPVRAARLPQDIPALIDVTLKAFQYPDHPEWSVQADEKEAIVDQLRSLRRLWPALSVMQRVSPTFRDLFSALVWEEDGAPVGNVFIMRLGDSARYEIANVAVLPAYRRRGIARQLVEAAITLGRERKAASLTLDVIAGNLPAVTLYTSLGFTRYVDTVTLSHPQDTSAPAIPLPEGYTQSQTSFANWRPRYELAKRITPAEVVALDPVAEDEYRVAPAERITTMIFAPLSGIRPRQLMIRASDGAPVSVTRYFARTRPGGVTNCWPLLDPAHAELAPWLIRTLRQSLQQQSPGRRLEMIVPDWQQSLIMAALAEGFTERERNSKMLKTL
ncbi:MAG TPA: GNAT family N-acetyltransferase [Ktedonobacterales bacterium]|nr:GNAT family N-acetyltransferase [Ktedonobacterales bacterium]